MFDKIKAGTLQKMEYALEKKEVDKPALKLLKAINAKKDFFTSSSCYGRILLIDFGGEKGKSRFASRWHRKVSFSEIRKTLSENNGRQIWFRAEPFILHVSCRNLAAAEKVLNIKNKLCIKRGGVFHISKNRIQIELEGTQRMEALVKIGKKIAVSDALLKTLVAVANKRFGENTKDWKEMEREFRKI